MMHSWDFYLAAMRGETPETTPGKPHIGFYRSRHGYAVGIWPDATGDSLICVRTHGKPDLTSIEQIDAEFSRVCRNPITRNLFMEVLATGKWPEDVEPPQPDETLPPAERIAAQIKALREQYAKELPDGVRSEEEDAKAAKFAELAQALKKSAEDTHRVEKAPHLEKGRAVDKAWKPVIEAADEAKRAFLAPTRDYRIKRDAEERRKREAEIERQRQEAERIAREAAEQHRMDAAVATVMGEEPPPPPPPPPPITMPPKKPSGLRTVEVVEITDLRALALQIVESNQRPAEFDELLKKIARAWLKEGIEVKGARLTTEKRAA